MLPSIEKLLILQDRDRKLFRARAELGSIAPQRQLLQSKLADVQSKFEAAKNRGKHVESERKRLELEVESKKQLIQKYSLQQFQTKKNEEYRALAHEIDMCKEAITKLEDQQLEFMEQAEQIAKETAAANTLAQSQKRDVDKQIADLAALEGSLKKQIAEDESTRATLGAVVDPSVLSRYERLLKSKGENVVVGIDHGVCGGCHMRLNTQTVRTVQGETDITNCPHCGRILYYTREMELAVVD